ncbi:MULTISPECIES: WD40 repeat domain-containing protein [Petrotoga]|uniref:WD40 repeat domain-containing protein n=1 Tax=Petrotoga TaxID=28236 RepID=UPI0011AED26D|nr:MULTISPECIES: WD40 repeat domain-containing protein [Petrotoga]
MRKSFLIFFLTIFSINIFSNLIVNNFEHSEIIDFFVNENTGEISTIVENNYLKTYDLKEKRITHYYSTSSIPTHVEWILDNKYTIIAESDGTIEVFNNDTSLLNYKINVTDESISSLSSFRDKIIFTSLDKTVYVYNITKRKVEFQRRFSTIPTVAEFYDERTILVADHSGKIFLIDYLNNKEIKAIEIDNYSIIKLSIVNNNVFAFSMNGNIYVLDKDLKIINSFSLGLTIREVSFSPLNENFTVLTMNNQIILFDSSTLKILEELKPDNFNIKAIEWSNEKNDILYLNDGVNIYSLNIYSKSIEKLLELKKPDVIKIIRNNNHIYYLTSDSEIGVFNIDSGIIENHFSFSEEIVDFEITKNGYLILSENSGYLSLYNSEGTLIENKKISDFKLTTLEISPSEKFLIAGGWENNVYVLTLPDLSVYKVVENLHNNWIKDISINYNETKIAVASLDKKVSISDFPKFKNTIYIEEFPYIIWSLDWANNSNFLSMGGFEGILRLWDGRFNQLYKRFEIITASIKAIEWSHDDNYIATGTTDGNVYIWNSKNGNLESTINVSNGEIVDLTWSNDERYLYALSKGNLLSLIDLQQNNIPLQSIIFEKGYSVSYRKNGEYTTNIPEQVENKFFYKNNPISLFEAVTFERKESINIPILEGPVINVPSEFLISDKNNSLLLSAFDNNLITKVEILGQTFLVNSQSYYLSLEINPEKLTSNVLEISAYDDDGNKSTKYVHLKFENIYLQVFTNQAEITNEQGEIIAIASRGDILKLKGVLGDTYKVEYIDKEGYIKKAFVTL